jgi:hypothetical protein
MKNNFKTIIVLVCSVFTSFGQEEVSNKYFIGLNGGYSNLSGNLIKNEYADSSSGYSHSNGINFGLEGGCFLKKNFGIATVISTSSFSSNGLQTLADGFQEDFEVDSITLKASGNYSIYNFLVGPIFSISKGKFSFNAKVLGGLVYAVTPEYKVDIEDQLDATFYQRSATAATFGVQTGLSFSYLLTDHLGLKVGVDYNYSKPNFSITNENREVNVGRKITEYNQKITILNTSLGVIYSF